MGGWLARRPQGMPETRSQLEDEITILLAGRAAETIVFGEPGIGAGGVLGSDLHLATRLAAGLVGSFGVGPFKMFVAPVEATNVILSYADLRSATAEILDEGERRAREILLSQRAAFDLVAAELARKRRLDGHEIARLIDAAAIEREPPRSRRRERSARSILDLDGP
jgi:ATP-dependent Zn protease